MKTDEIVTKKEQIKQKIRYGDFITLGEMLGITPSNAKMRFRRNKENAVLGMEKIIVTRETLVMISPTDINQ